MDRDRCVLASPASSSIPKPTSLRLSRASDEGERSRSKTDSLSLFDRAANVIFLDQPINVGYSYSDTGKVNTSPVAAEDVFSFLELFFARYKKYAKSEFHISGESYAGTYLSVFSPSTLGKELLD